MKNFTNKFINNLFKVTFFLLKLPKNFISFLEIKLNKAQSSFNNSTIELLSHKFDEKGRYLEYTFLNKGLNPYSGIKAVYDHLVNDSTYLVFGTKKIIITFASSEIFGSKVVKTLHHNVVVTNKTTFDIFYETIKESIETLTDQAYPELPYIDTFIVKVWNGDSIYNKRIKTTKDARSILPKVNLVQTRGLKTAAVKYPSNNITPLKAPTSVVRKDFYAMDIETVTLNGFQTPALISFVGKGFSECFQIIPETLSVEDLFDEFLDFCVETLPHKKNVIFLHNLGSFDGIFIYKHLIQYYSDQVEAIIDESNKFITITLKLEDMELIFKDSLSCEAARIT